jgi:glutathione S-transferase
MNHMPLTESLTCDLTLYTHPWSRGQIARWMLEETGVPYRHTILDYAGSMKSPEYLSINPMGKVPAIVHRGNAITECAAICAYLADAFPQAALAPAPSERAGYYRWLFFAAGPLEAAVTNRNLKVTVAEDQQRMVGYGTYERTLDVLAKAVSATPYITGDQFSAADVYVGSHLIWGAQFGSIPPREEFTNYMAKLTARPTYQAAKKIDTELGEKLAAR